nr:glycoside hydrolase family 97 catalytic domain-containing protein [uncultured Carboxylicivirga sp.]
MKLLNTLIIILLLGVVNTFARTITINSPNQKLQIQLINDQKSDYSNWYLKVEYLVNEHYKEIIPRIDLGLEREDQLFSKELKLVKTSKIHAIHEDYTSRHGKRSNRTNDGNEVLVNFITPQKSKLNLFLRTYNDGVAFRYEFPDKEGSYIIHDELTAYSISDSTKRWLEKFNPANEGLYSCMLDGSVQKDWCYPALFQSQDNDCWFLIHEADLNRNYCGTKLTNYEDGNVYKLSFPDEWNGRGTGKIHPSIALPWKSPWRTIMVGSLADIVESTLIDDLSSPSTLKDTSWIKPGLASWNYWSDNHGTKDYQVVCKFADLAADMGWPYTLLDWEWDAMSNGGNLNDALSYIHSLGLKPLIWYNSGGDHTWVGATPKDRMLTHENRMAEFKKLKEMGIAGVKVDFFESEKQNMINYYLDILEDAARFEIMVYFHGCLVPRGWQRTYPHLMTYEGVRGAEWYNNGPEFTTTAPEHNTTLPFTRNVVGSMDYTPVTFTNSQYPHITSYAHELALSVVFESGIQHMADRPEGYNRLPYFVKNFLRTVPCSWDNTKLLDGYPGQFAVLARRKGNVWYMGGINSDSKEKNQTVKFDFLPIGKTYKLTLISDREHDQAFSIKHLIINSNSVLNVNMLRRGGFAARIISLN